MKGAKQPSLLDLGEPEIDSEFSGIRRTELVEKTWVDHLPNWLKGHQKLFKILKKTTRWLNQQLHMYDQVIEVPLLLADFQMMVQDIP